ARIKKKAVFVKTANGPSSLGQGIIDVFGISVETAICDRTNARMRINKTGVARSNALIMAFLNVGYTLT
ncbi:MAG: hypothetical protein QXF26_02510, partial [Candidatus Bathyarchaeia archaeon]